MSVLPRSCVVVGLGKSGLAVLTLCRAKNIAVRAFDEADGAGAAAARAMGVEVHTGPLANDFFSGAEAVVVSPGVPHRRAPFDAARAAGLPVMGEIEFGALALPSGAGPILGITGTNGKSTTTALLGALLEAAGKDTFVGGNLGRPFCEAAQHAYEVHALELSSYQLETIDTLHVSSGALLNLTPDHLERYPSMAEYLDAKARMFRNSRDGDAVVLNADDAPVFALRTRVQGEVFGFTTRGERVAGVPMAVATDGGFRFEFGGRRAFSVTSRALRGKHNLENAMAAALVARGAGVADDAIQQGLDTFGGLPHRLEFVRELGGVEWINDSKATNVDSTLVALRALSRPLWLIAGGKGKGAPYQPLVEEGRGKLLGVLTVGQDAPNIEAAFQKATPVHPCQTIERAVEFARTHAKPGQIVLLSPACASFDQFKNFEHRGDAFKMLVNALA